MYTCTEEIALVHDASARSYSIMLKGCQSVRAELIFTPTQVASYDFILPITLNNLPAPTPAPTPMPRTPFSTATTMAADVQGAAKLARADGGSSANADAGSKRRELKSRSSVDAGGSGSGSGSGSGPNGDGGSSGGRSGTMSGGVMSGAGAVEPDGGDRVTPKRRIVATALRQPLEISANSLDFLLPATFIRKLEKHGPEAYAKLLTKVLMCTPRSYKI